jgi:integrase
VDGSLEVQQRTKTSGSSRVLVVPEFTRRMLIERRERLQPTSSNDLVFASTSGTPQDPDNLRRLWRRVREQAGLDWVTPHTIRKTVATLLDTKVSTKAAAS